jgi:preprotein translocase subunit YajC
VESLIPLALLAVAFYFLVLRPTRKQRAKADAIRAALAPGAEVVTAGGMKGTVVTVDDEVVTLEIAPGVQVHFLPGAIRTVTSGADELAEQQTHPSDPPEPTT